MGTSLTAATDTAGTHAWRASGPRDLARLIRNARRHSARVRLMRISVPTIAIGGIAALALFIWFNPLRALSDLPVSVDNLVVSGTKITMEAPKLTGFTRDNRAYHVSAEAATQDLTNPAVLELSGIRAKIEMQNKATVDMTAVAGLYNTKSELLTLTQYIVLMSSDGYEGHLTEATADVKKGHIVSEKPVEVFLPNGKLNANRMEVVDNGELLRFEGGTILNLNPSRSGAADKKATRPSGALQGFSVNQDKPIQITSATLEVRDKEKKATFSGNVVATQGDSTMKSKTLDAYYDQDGASADAKAAGPAGQQQIRRLEAKGGVVVTQRDQTATGETGIFDVRANTVTLLGGVVITQGPQVIKGERLTADLTTGVSHVEGRVSGLLIPNNRQKAGDSKTRDAKGTQPPGPPNALQGFSVNRDKPIQITSTSLEVRDKEKKATFVENVLVAQGDTTMKSKTLDVDYDQDGVAAEAKPTQSAPPEQQQVRRLEAKGGVIVTQKDQTATGETGIYDMPTNTVTLIGSVVATQGPNVVRGDRLTVDLTSGVSHVEGGTKGVQALFNVHSRPKVGDSKGGDAKPEDGKPGETKAADTKPGDVKESGRGKDGSKPAAKSTPGQPLKLN